MTAPSLQSVRDLLPEAAKDVRLNLQTVLESGALTETRRLGVALAAAFAVRQPLLRDAMLTEARARLGEAAEAVIDDARAAAALMAMTNVAYRFNHLVQEPTYGERPLRLRMNRLGRPAGTKADLELYSLAVSALNGCGACVQAHERGLRQAGLGPDEVHDAIRIAATVHSAAVALDSLAEFRPIPAG